MRPVWTSSSRAARRRWAEKIEICGGYIATRRIDAVNEAMDLQAMRGGILDWRRAQGILGTWETKKERFLRRCESATRVAAFLAAHPRVTEVFHPSRPDHPDRDIIAKHYVQPGSLMSFRVAAAGSSPNDGETVDEGASLDEEGARHFADVLAMTIVPRYALSFDGLATKLNHHRTVSEYFTPARELESAGIDRLVRLGVGLESPDDIIACLNWALWHHESVPEDDVRRWQDERARSLGIYGHAPED